MRCWGWALLIVLALSTYSQADDKPDPIVDGKSLTAWIIESKEPPTDPHVRSAYAHLGEFVGEPRAAAALHEAWGKENRYAALIAARGSARW